MSFSASVGDLVEASEAPLVQAAPAWPREPLGDVADILNGFPFKSDYFTSGPGDPLIRIRDVTSGFTETRYAGPRVDGYWVELGDLVVGMDGDFNSRIWSAPRGLLNQRVCKISPDARVLDLRFLSYLLPGYLRLINEATHSVTVKHLSSKTLQELPLPLPPLAEQRRIVTKLDALTARTALARADLDRIPALAAGYKLSLLRTAMRGGLTEAWRQQVELEPASALVERTPAPPQGRGGREATTGVRPGAAALSVNDPGTPAPDGWAWTSLLRIARQETGHTPSRSVDSYWGGEVPWIGIRDAGAHHGRTIEATLQTITENGLANSSARVLPARTVCLSRTASVGYVTIMARPMATSQDFATWTCSEALEPEFLMYALMAEGDDIRAFGEGSTHTTIYFPEIRALHICLPPLAEQKEIIRRVRAGLIEIDRLAAESAAARRLLDRLDQAVLAKAFRGELVPQDPTDEPASVLLDRIRAERAAAPKTKRVKRTAMA